MMLLPNLEEAKIARMARALHEKHNHSVEKLYQFLALNFPKGGWTPMRIRELLRGP